MPPRVGGYYGNDGVGGARLLPGAEPSGYILSGADIALTANTNITVASTTITLLEDGSYYITADFNCAILLGGVAPTSVIFQLNTLGESGRIPTPFLTANAQINQGISLGSSVNLIGFQRAGTAVGCALQVQSNGQASTWKAGSNGSFALVRISDR